MEWPSVMKTSSVISLFFCSVDDTWTKKKRTDKTCAHAVNFFSSSMSNPRYRRTVLPLREQDVGRNRLELVCLARKARLLFSIEKMVTPCLHNVAQSTFPCKCTWQKIFFCLLVVSLKGSARFQRGSAAKYDTIVSQEIKNSLRYTNGHTLRWAVQTIELFSTLHTIQKFVCLSSKKQSTVRNIFSAPCDKKVCVSFAPAQAQASVLQWALQVRFMPTSALVQPKFTHHFTERMRLSC